MRRIVRYINLPPTLCRSEETLHFLFFVALPRQYFYLSCETAIQIDEVKQHDIFCTSITLRGWATWVESQQTITFLDTPHPPTPTVTVDGFSLTKHSLSPRTERALKCLLFSSPRYALAPCPNRDELRSRKAEQSSALGRGGKSAEWLQCILTLRSQVCRAAGKEAHHTATTALCQLRFDSAAIRKGSLGNEIRWRRLEKESFYGLF